MDGYKVNLSVYEGPLDLLLYLIKRDEVDIYDIPIAVITEQYLSYMDLMLVLDLEVAGDFLVMAAQLMEIKSRMLLPPSVEEASGGEDPRAGLVQKLLEYRKYRDAAEALVKRDLLDRDVFARRFIPEEVKDVEGDEVMVEASLFDLLTAFKSVMDRASVKDLHEVQKEHVTVVERINDILKVLSSSERLSFSSLFPEGARKNMIIATFLALLELIRLKLVKAVQKGPTEDIWLFPTPKARETAGFTEADLNQDGYR